ncbi:MAG: hypothetical protein ACRC62_01905 [Microcoleus sp.]
MQNRPCDRFDRPRNDINYVINICTIGSINATAIAPFQRQPQPRVRQTPRSPGSRRGTINAIVLNAYIEKATNNATGEN